MSGLATKYLRVFRNLPQFKVHGSSVKVLSKPSEYYQELTGHIQKAQQRVLLSSLYFGTGIAETSLVNTLKQCLHGRKANRDVQVQFLLDFFRASRIENGKSSRTMLLPLLKEFPSQVAVSLFQTCGTGQKLRHLIPMRYSEIFGLQHSKIHVIDDSVIMTGANLSNLYFTHRQDRYVVIERCSRLANFLAGLFDVMSQFSVHLSGCGSIASGGPDKHPLLGGQTAPFLHKFCASLGTFFLSWVVKEGKDLNTADACDTIVYPTIQSFNLGSLYDQMAYSTLIDSLPAGANLYHSSGYFNPTEEFQQVLLRHLHSGLHCLVPSPGANGFYNGQGASGSIPAIYQAILRQFLEKVEIEKFMRQALAHGANLKGTGVMKVYEYSRPGWSFHAKGLWLYEANEQLPCLTAIGSSNYSRRSEYRDFEVQLYILTDNTELRHALHNERLNLWEHSQEVTLDTMKKIDFMTSLWTSVAVSFFGSFL